MSFRFLAHLSGLFVLAASLSAQTSVWKVTRGTATVYLGGTCHVLRSGDLPLPAEFEQAFAASSTLVFETDVERMRAPDMQQIIIMEGVFTDGRTLQDVLSPKAWKAAQAYCAKAGLPIQQYSLMKPWLFTVTIASLEMQKLGVSAEGVDVIYHKKATAARKKTGELESFERHIEFITRLGAGHENEMVAQSIDELSDLPAVVNALLNAWKIGDLARLDDLILREMRAKYATIYRELIVKRNDAWLPKIEEHFKTPEVEFILAGVGHMAGKDGLIARLRAKGYTVTQLKATATRK